MLFLVENDKKYFVIYIKLATQPLKPLITLTVKPESTMLDVINSANSILSHVVIRVGVLGFTNTYLDIESSLKEVKIVEADNWYYMEDGDYYMTFPKYESDWDLNTPLNVIACLKEK